MALPRPPPLGVVAAVGTMLLLVPGCTGDFEYANFNDVSDLRILGVANRTQDRLRLTPSREGLVGSAWYSVMQSVIGGFQTDFTFRISLDPDQLRPGPCRLVDNLAAECERLGGDGLVFVVQNAYEHAIGGGGADLGYGGVPNGLAVEFDTWTDPHLDDPHGLHLAVLTRGRAEMRPDHSTHLGATVEVPDFADGRPHKVRITYDPEFHNEAAMHKSFQAAPYLTRLMEADGHGAGWEHGLGTLKVYIDDMDDAALTVPTNLGAHLALDSGRAFVGFTASTGLAFENHEVLTWMFQEHQNEFLQESARRSAEQAQFNWAGFAAGRA